MNGKNEGQEDEALMASALSPEAEPKTDVQKLSDFLKEFATDEQIEEARWSYDIKYGYEAYYKAVCVMGQVDSDEHTNEWFDEYTGALFVGLMAIMDVYHSNRDWEDEDFIDLANLLICIEASMQKVASRLIKKIVKKFPHYKTFFD